jgi:hypothetical protein
MRAVASVTCTQLISAFFRLRFLFRLEACAIAGGKLQHALWSACVCTSVASRRVAQASRCRLLSFETTVLRRKRGPGCPSRHCPSRTLHPQARRTPPPRRLRRRSLRPQRRPGSRYPLLERRTRGPERPYLAGPVQLSLFPEAQVSAAAGVMLHAPQMPAAEHVSIPAAHGPSAPSSAQDRVSSGSQSAAPAAPALPPSAGVPPTLVSPEAPPPTPPASPDPPLAEPALPPAPWPKSRSVDAQLKATPKTTSSPTPRPMTLFTFEAARSRNTGALSRRGRRAAAVVRCIRSVQNSTRTSRYDLVALRMRCVMTRSAADPVFEWLAVKRSLGPQHRNVVIV